MTWTGRLQLRPARFLRHPEIGPVRRAQSVPGRARLDAVAGNHRQAREGL